MNGRYVIGLRNGMSSNGRRFCMVTDGTSAVPSGPGCFSIHPGT